MKERRNKQQIYADILNSINDESDHDDVKVTRVQLSSKLSYDKLKIYLHELDKFRLIELKPIIKVTIKGNSFVNDSFHITDNIKKLNKIYFSDNSNLDKQMFSSMLKKNKSKNIISNNESNSEHKIKEYQQIQNAMKATIDELSKK